MRQDVDILIGEAKMLISEETYQVLLERGYDSVKDYLEELSDECGQPYSTVLMMAVLLGEEELFDGLVTSLEDF